jgi:tetratricopeptide (TPR) repeat protein
VAVTLVGGRTNSAQGQIHQAHTTGSVDFPVSCSPGVQAEFNRAVALLHHMTYPRAREAFQEVARVDARCAMAYWGVAMTLFQPLWPTRPGLPERRQGWEAAENAARLGAATERERLLISAVAAFFSEPESSNYWERIRRWEQAMTRAWIAFPKDPEIVAFYALAHIASAPANDDSVAAYSARAAELLLEVYRQNPDHPGAMHYLVHANDAPGRERLSLDVTQKYEASAPRNPHALHMPTHIYTRLGDWDAVVRGNLLSAEAALEHGAGERGEYVWDEFPHAIEYVIYAYLQQGADDEALTQLKRLHGTSQLEPTFKTAFHLASTQARYTLERRAWREAALLGPREALGIDWDRYSWPEAVTWFARGLAAVRERRIDEARASTDRLAALSEKAGQAGEDLFARNIRVLELEVRAWLAHGEGDEVTSSRLMGEAADLESSTPKHAVTPAPTLPAHELWGDLLIEQGRSAEALAMYRTSLELYPKRFNSLIGAARAAAATGDSLVARNYYQELLTVAPGSRRAELEEARRYTGARQQSPPYQPYQEVTVPMYLMVDTLDKAKTVRYRPPGA